MLLDRIQIILATFGDVHFIILREQAKNPCAHCVWTNYMIGLDDVGYDMPDDVGYDDRP